MDLKNVKNFTEYYNLSKIPTQKFYCAFQGIKRKEYPRWVGWDYIDGLKGIKNVSEIEGELIDLLVENFYLIRYIGITFYPELEAKSEALESLEKV